MTNLRELISASRIDLDFSWFPFISVPLMPCLCRNHCSLSFMLDLFWAQQHLNLISMLQVKSFLGFAMSLENKGGTSLYQREYLCRSLKTLWLGKKRKWYFSLDNTRWVVVVLALLLMRYFYGYFCSYRTCHFAFCISLRKHAHLEIHVFRRN